MTFTITRVAHACVLLDFEGHRLLTDPWFSERRGYYRGEPLAFTPDGLPELAGVLVSHGHYDHFGGLVGFLRSHKGSLKAKLPPPTGSANPHPQTN